MNHQTVRCSAMVQWPCPLWINLNILIPAIGGDDMPVRELEKSASSLHERTLTGIDQVLEHALDHVDGLEKVIVNRAIQILRPRVVQRIGIATEEELQAELEYLYKLLGSILAKPQKKKIPTAQKKRLNHRSP